MQLNDAWQQRRHFLFEATQTRWRGVPLDTPEIPQILGLVCSNGPIEPLEAEAILARRDQLNKMERLSLQLKWLRENGFADVDVVYKNRSFVVLFGKKT